MENIIKKTVDLQCEHVFRMEKQLGQVSDSEIVEELKRKREITLANHVVDEVKGFLRT